MIYKIKNTDSIIFDIEGQDFLYSASTVSYYPITKCARELFLDDNFIKYNKISNLLYQRFSKKEILLTKKKVREFYNTEIIKPIECRLEDNFIFSDYTLKLIPTTRCNLNCKYCFVNKKSKENDMSLDVAKKAIDFFITRFVGKDVKRYIIDLTGSGEPLLRLDFILKINEYVLKLKKLKNINIFCQLATNGMLLDEETSSLLKRNQILFGVSLDGGKEKSEEHRKGLNYDIVIENINNIENKDFFGIGATFSGNNFDFISIFKSLYNLNPEVIGIKPVRLNLDDENSIHKGNIKKIKDSYVKFCNFILKNLTNGEREVFNKFIKSEDYFARFLKILLHPTRVYYRCSAGLSSIAVDSRENILICPSFVNIKDGILGNLNTGILNNKYEEFRNYYSDKISYCKNCWARYACAGECFSVSYNNFNLFTKPLPVMCELKKHLIQLAIYFWSILKYDYPEIYKECLNKY